jgi:hypothetical protein
MPSEPTAQEIETAKRVHQFMLNIGPGPYKWEDVKSIIVEYDLASRRTALPPERECCRGKGDPPADCDAPFCGCNPAWTQALEAAYESGWRRHPAPLPPEVAELKRLYEATTKGEWGVSYPVPEDEDDDGVHILTSGQSDTIAPCGIASDIVDAPTAEFIAAAHNLLPRLLELIEGKA